MSANSGEPAACDNQNYRHWNNEHRSEKFKAKGHPIKWKICYTGDHGKEQVRAICKKCLDHPAAGPDGFEEMVDLTDQILDIC